MYTLDIRDLQIASRNMYSYIIQNTLLQQYTLPKCAEKKGMMR